jgi:hypothetical protein
MYRYIPSAYLLFLLGVTLPILACVKPRSLFLLIFEALLLLAWTIIRIGRWPFSP